MRIATAIFPLLFLCGVSQGKTLSDFHYVSGSDLSKIDLTKSTNPVTDKMNGVTVAWSMEKVGERYAAVGLENEVFIFSNACYASQLQHAKTKMEELIPPSGTSYSDTANTFYFVKDLRSFSSTFVSTKPETITRLQDVYKVLSLDVFFSRGDMYGSDKTYHPDWYTGFSEGDTLDYTKSYRVFHTATEPSGSTATGALNKYWRRYSENDLDERLNIQVQGQTVGTYAWPFDGGSACVYAVYGGCITDYDPLREPRVAVAPGRTVYSIKSSSLNYTISQFGESFLNNCVFVFKITYSYRNWETGYNRDYADNVAYAVFGVRSGIKEAVEELLKNVSLKNITDGIVSNSEVRDWMKFPTHATMVEYRDFLRIDICGVFFVENIRSRTNYDR